MVRFTFFALFVVLISCGVPAQYTVLNAVRPNSSGGSSDQVNAWPEFSEWEASKSAPNDTAVIIAIEDYAFLPDVEGAVKNANDWEQYFRVQRGMSDVFVLTNQDAPIEEIQRFITQATAATNKAGTLWFVFIGHGAAKTDGTDGLLIGMDAQQTPVSLNARSLSKGDVIKLLDEGKQSQTVVVLDTCFSGRSPDGQLLAKGTQPVIPISSTPVTQTGLTLLTAAKGDQIAGQLPGSRRPAFTYLLLGALRGWADADADKEVTTAEAITFTQRNLRLLKGRQQTPELSGKNDTILSKNVVEPDPGVHALMSNGGSVSVPSADVSVTASADGTRIDTGKGIIVPKMDQWALPNSVFPGVTYQTQRMTGHSTILVLSYKMSQSMAAAQIGNMTSEPPGFDSTWVDAPSEKRIGNYTGTLLSYVETFEGLPDKFHVQFMTYQGDGLWIFDLQTDSQDLVQKRDEEFRTFIENSEFK